MIMPQTEVVTIRLDAALKERLDALATSTHRSKSWLAAAAIERYLAEEGWQIAAMTAAATKADDPNTGWVQGDAVMAWLDSWGTDAELNTPCA